MITSILALFSSGAFGSLTGLIGGYFNRKLDIEIKKQDHDFELKKMDKDLEFMEAEYEQRGRIATIEAEGKEAVAGYEALTKSYDYAPINGSGWVDSFSKIIRPFLTLCFFFASVYIFYVLNAFLEVKELDKETLQKLYITCIEWFLFQAGVCVGWWFANRPSKK